MKHDKNYYIEKSKKEFMGELWLGHSYEMTGSREELEAFISTMYDELTTEKDKAPIEYIKPRHIPEQIVGEVKVAAFTTLTDQDVIDKINELVDAVNALATEKDKTPEKICEEMCICHYPMPPKNTKAYKVVMNTLARSCSHCNAQS